MNISNESYENVSDVLQISQLNSAVFKSTLIPSFIYTWILLIIGVPGNALVCYVYQFKIRNKRLSSNIFILALSWFDLINCLISLPIEIKFILNFIQFDEPVLCKLSRFLTFFCNNSSSIILLAIAVDRLVAFLSGPIRRRLKPHMAIRIVAMAMCISACVSWPMLLFFGTYTFSVGENIFGKSCLISNKFVKSEYMVIFTIALLSLHILFDLAFLVIYSIIGKRICYDSGLISADTGHMQLARLQTKRESESSDDIFVTQDEVLKSRSPSPCMLKFKFIQPENRSSSKLAILTQTSSDMSKATTSTDDNDSKSSSPIISQGNTNSFIERQRHRSSECKIFNRRATASRTSFMLFIVTMAYVISFLPYCIIVLIRHISNDTFYLELSNTEKAMYQLFLRSYALSSAINPLIYSFINYSFRKKCISAINDILSCIKMRIFNKE